MKLSSEANVAVIKATQVFEERLRNAIYDRFKSTFRLVNAEDVEETVVRLWKERK